MFLILSRLRQSPPNSVATLAGLLMTYTEKCVRRYPSNDMCMLLPQCWDTLLEAHVRCISGSESQSLLASSSSWKLRKMVLKSILAAIDESSWCTSGDKREVSFGPLGDLSPMPPALADALRLRAYRNISLISYYKLGEHAVLLGNVSGNVTGALSSSQDLS